MNGTVDQINKALESGLSIPHLKDKTGTCLDLNDQYLNFFEGYFQGEVNIRKCSKTPKKD